MTAVNHPCTSLSEKCFIYLKKAALHKPDNTAVKRGSLSTNTHKHTHTQTCKALPHVGSYQAPYTSPSHSLSVSLHLCNPFHHSFCFSLGSPFMCFLSALSEASYCVTHADSTVPRLYCTFAATHRKGVVFVLETCHPMPCTKCLQVM